MGDHSFFVTDPKTQLTIERLADREQTEPHRTVSVGSQRPEQADNQNDAGWEYRYTTNHVQSEDQLIRV